MAAGTLPILIGWNLVALPLAVWLLSKRDTRYSTRSYRRSL